jgi:predicted nucleotidyltransferase component of viral defense system
LTRFSTDIDLDLLDLGKEQDIIQYMDHLLVSMGESEKIVGRDLHRWRFRYDPNGWIIKIELNKRQSLYTKYKQIIIDDTPIQAQDLTSMVTNKLLALGNRRYNRDLYDIHFFLNKGYTFDEKIVNDRESLSLHQWISTIIDQIPNRFQHNTILHQLGEVVDDSQKPRVKNHLATETIKLLQLYLDTH